MLRSFADKCLASARVPELFRRFAYKNGVSILMYHAVVDRPLGVPDWCFVDAKDFLGQMEYLKERFQVIPLRDVPRWRNNGKPAVALTFDDGYWNNYSVVYPILKQLGFPASIFLVTDFVGSNDTIWFCRVIDALDRTQLSEFRFNGKTYDLRTRASKQTANAAIQAWLKSFPHQELLVKLKEVVSGLGEAPDKPIPPGSPYRMLGPEEIREMDRSGLIQFGGHTSSHATLSLLQAGERLREIEQSLKAVESLIGRPCELFAYPNGRDCDWGEIDVAVLSSNGVDAAVTTMPGPNVTGANPLVLRRYGVGAGTSLAAFQMIPNHLRWFLGRTVDEFDYLRLLKKANQTARAILGSVVISCASATWDLSEIVALLST